MSKTLGPGAFAPGFPGGITSVIGHLLAEAATRVFGHHADTTSGLEVVGDVGTPGLSAVTSADAGAHRRPESHPWDDLPFTSATEIREHLARRRREAAQEELARLAALEEARDAAAHRLETEHLTEEQIRHGTSMATAAFERGDHEYLLLRFPNSLCTDGGRAINNAEDGWTDTLTGVPRELYEMWKERLRPLGYGLEARIIDWPNLMPGDVGLFLTLHDGEDEANQRAA